MNVLIFRSSVKNSNNNNNRNPHIFFYNYKITKTKTMSEDILLSQLQCCYNHDSSKKVIKQATLFKYSNNNNNNITNITTTTSTTRSRTSRNSMTKKENWNNRNQNHRQHHQQQQQQSTFKRKFTTNANGTCCCCCHGAGAGAGAGDYDGRRNIRLVQLAVLLQATLFYFLSVVVIETESFSLSLLPLSNHRARPSQQNLNYNIINNNKRHFHSLFGIHSLSSSNKVGYCCWNKHDCFFSLAAAIQNHNEENDDDNHDNNNNNNNNNNTEIEKDQNDPSSTEKTTTTSPSPSLSSLKEEVEGLKHQVTSFVEEELERLSNQLTYIEALEERNKAQLDSFIDEEDQWNSMEEEERILLKCKNSTLARMELLTEQLIELWMGQKSMEG